MTTLGYTLIGGAILIAFLAMLYNRLVALRQTTRNAFADIDVQMKQRYDLIPNLVETVKGYATHESGIMTQVTEARASAMKATTITEKGVAESALSGALMQLMAVAENYPDLKANQNFQQLQSELSDLENKLAAARRFFNSAVTEYNTAIEQFPAVLIARLFAFAPTGMFDLGDTRATLDTPPKVSF
ncbi:MAG: LemA family protein [Alphaproteobacteria bacterium]|nr:LemA family protein [Alphaproteobacteria bacterium]